MFQLRTFLLLSLFWTPLLSWSQSPVGQWHDHFSYTHAHGLTLTPSSIYCSTTGGFFYITRADRSVHPFSKVNGLSDHGVAAAAYAHEMDKLLIAYENTNLDLVRSDGIRNMNDILRKPMPGEKKIHNILVAGNRAYLSCSFGIVVVDMQKEEISETYYIGEGGTPLSVNDFTLWDGFFYAATDDGLYRASADTPDLVWYGAWERVSGLPTSHGRYTAVTHLGACLFVNLASSQDSVLYYTDNDNWTLLYTQPSTHVERLRTSNDHLMVIAGGEILIYDHSLILQKRIDDYGFGTAQAADALYDPEGTLWIADHNAGLLYSPEGVDFFGATPPGPYYPNVFRISAWDHTLAIAGGGYDASWTPLYQPAMLFLREQDQWTSLIRYDIKDIVRILPDPHDPSTIYLSSWNYGIVVVKDHEISTIYNESNSTLQSIIPGQNYIRVGGMVFDREHRLWVTNCQVNEPISFMEEGGKWKSLPYGKTLRDMTLGDIVIDRNDFKWVVLPRGGGLFVFDDRHTPGDPSDDRTKKMPVIDQEGTLHNMLHCITVDHNGYIWVGTDQGPMVYYNPYYVFEQGVIPVQRIKVPRNDGSGLADYLLGTELVTSIAVDGADRKWIGTRRSGAFLVSPDGLHIIRHFSASNSPLPSDNIVSIAIDPVTGMVYFGTDKGVVSYHGTATEGKILLSNIKVYPNPVREDYEGPVVITGLTENAYVTITDISGNLVFSTTSLGGQALWKITNMAGERVATGVYLIFVTDQNGEQKKVGKVLVIR